MVIPWPSIPINGLPRTCYNRYDQRGKSRAEGTTEDRLLLNLELLIHFREEGSRLYSEIQVIPSIDDTLA